MLLFLMEQRVVSVKNIAVLAGFGDALYFSKVFKGQMGESPKKYIEKMQTDIK
jgi:transcriptional regulator GlxA family with amidase domain